MTTERPRLRPETDQAVSDYTGITKEFQIMTTTPQTLVNSLSENPAPREFVAMGQSKKRKHLNKESKARKHVRFGLRFSVMLLLGAGLGSAAIGGLFVYANGPIFGPMLMLVMGISAVVIAIAMALLKIEV